MACCRVADAPGRDGPPGISAAAPRACPRWWLHRGAERDAAVEAITADHLLAVLPLGTLRGAGARLRDLFACEGVGDTVCGTLDAGVTAAAACGAAVTSPAGLGAALVEQARVLPRRAAGRRRAGPARRLARRRTDTLARRAAQGRPRRTGGADALAAAGRGATRTGTPPGLQVAQTRGAVLVLQAGRPRWAAVTGPGPPQAKVGECPSPRSTEKTLQDTAAGRASRQHPGPIIKVCPIHPSSSAGARADRPALPGATHPPRGRHVAQSAGAERGAHQSKDGFRGRRRASIPFLGKGGGGRCARDGGWVRQAHGGGLRKRRRHVSQRQAWRGCWRRGP